MSGVMYPFNPALGDTQTIAATAASGAVTFQTKTPGETPAQILVTNAGATLAFVRMSRSSDVTAATAADTPVLPNDRFVLTNGSVSGEGLLVSAICPGGTTTLYFTPGTGI